MSGAQQHQDADAAGEEFMSRTVTWSRVEAINEGLLANVGESLLGVLPDEFAAAERDRQRLAAQSTDPFRSYANAVMEEAARQWTASEFDVDFMDQVIEVAVRGLQPSDVRAALDLPVASPALRDFVEQTRQLLDETIDLTQPRT